MHLTPKSAADIAGTQNVASITTLNAFNMSIDKVRVKL
jgi:hypothetical protein